MKRIIAFLICLLALPAAADVAINSGGGALDGYSTDRYYSGGNGRTFNDQAGVYKSERRSRSRFRYAIPVTPGVVEVTLRLRESCVTCSARTFRVNAEGKTVIPLITIPVNTVGDRTFSVQSSATLNLEFTALTGEAFVNAIEVRQLGVSAPVVNLAANPTSVSTGGSSVLSWTSTGATSCSSSGGWTGAKPVSGSESSGQLSSTRTFTLACTGQGGATTQSTSVAVNSVPAPTVSLTATPTSVTSGGSAMLNWNASNATGCTATGAWGGSKATTGSQSTGTLTANNTYTLTCNGAGGSASAAAAVTVTTPPPAPTVSLSANPSTVASGGTSLLTWKSSNATSCNGTGAWSGTKTTSGSQSVGPISANATFGLTCTGAGGSAAGSATVIIGNPLPTVSLSASPTSVASGGASTINWSSTNATSCTASGAWSGGKGTNGTESGGALTATSTYSLTCTGPGGSTSRSATVAVNGQHSYSTSFPLTENPIDESGVWRRANNIWTNVRTANGIAFGTNGIANSYDDSYALLSGFGPNQQAEAVVFRSPNLVREITHEVELLLRFSDDANNARGYECLFNYYGGVQIVRWNGAIGDFTVLPSTAGAGGLGRELVSGDVIRATIAGNVISTYINGVLIAEAVDSTFSSGQPGISFFIRPGGDSANLGLTSYSATDLP